MDIKDLNKGQFILLMILVCFVVSIATSITTYSLISGAPDSVKKPITQVVQRTVERIVEVPQGETLSKDELQLIEDLKSLKPLIDKLAKEEPADTNTTNPTNPNTDTTSTTTDTTTTENPNP
jgi:ABC-type lipoprotein release transport system permease subunit